MDGQPYTINTRLHTVSGALYKGEIPISNHRLHVFVVILICLLKNTCVHSSDCQNVGNLIQRAHALNSKIIKFKISSQKWGIALLKVVTEEKIPRCDIKLIVATNVIYVTDIANIFSPFTTDNKSMGLSLSSVVK